MLNKLKQHKLVMPCILIVCFILLREYALFYFLMKYVLPALLIYLVAFDNIPYALKSFDKKHKIIYKNRPSMTNMILTTCLYSFVLVGIFYLIIPLMNYIGPIAYFPDERALILPIFILIYIAIRCISNTIVGKLNKRKKLSETINIMRKTWQQARPMILAILIFIILYAKLFPYINFDEMAVLCPLDWGPGSANEACKKVAAETAQFSKNIEYIPWISGLITFIIVRIRQYVQRIRNQ